MAHRSVEYRIGSATLAMSDGGIVDNLALDTLAEGLSEADERRGGDRQGRYRGVFIIAIEVPTFHLPEERTINNPSLRYLPANSGPQQQALLPFLSRLVPFGPLDIVYREYQVEIMKQTLSRFRPLPQVESGGGIDGRRSRLVTEPRDGDTDRPFNPAVVDGTSQVFSTARPTVVLVNLQFAQPKTHERDGT